MTNYHLSSDGVKPCKAQINCPLGGVHGEDANVMQKLYEEKFEAVEANTNKLSRIAKRFKDRAVTGNLLIDGRKTYTNINEDEVSIALKADGVKPGLLEFDKSLIDNEDEIVFSTLERVERKQPLFSEQTRDQLDSAQLNGFDLAEFRALTYKEDGSSKGTYLMIDDNPYTPYVLHENIEANGETSYVAIMYNTDFGPAVSDSAAEALRMAKARYNAHAKDLLANLDYHANDDYKNKFFYVNSHNVNANIRAIKEGLSEEKAEEFFQSHEGHSKYEKTDGFFANQNLKGKSEKYNEILSKPKNYQFNNVDLPQD